MNETVGAALSEWKEFYLITGGAAAALTGLQFVVQTLISSDDIRPVTAGDPEGGIEAFGTPTVVHFTLALVFSCLMCVPWTGYGGLRASLGALSVVALVYSANVLRRARRQRAYTPVFEDWLWHIILPFAAYAGVLVSAYFLGDGGHWELFDIAGVTLLLLCIGIHNAWDTVTYLTLNAMRAAPAEKKSAPPQGRKRRR